MDAATAELLTAFEIHSAESMRAVLDGGFDVRARIDARAPSSTSSKCTSGQTALQIALLLERGAILHDPKLAPVLLKDAEALAKAVRNDPDVLNHRTSMACVFTPCQELRSYM
jgi:hypothetical protein